jgi:hypothetical protein
MNFADAGLIVGVAGPGRELQRRASARDNALNRRIDSPWRNASGRPAYSGEDRIFASARKSGFGGVFQLPAGAFLLNTCALGSFFAQKTKVAAADQIDRCQNLHAKVQHGRRQRL